MSAKQHEDMVSALAAYLRTPTRLVYGEEMAASPVDAKVILQHASLVQKLLKIKADLVFTAEEVHQALKEVVARKPRWKMAESEVPGFCSTMQKRIRTLACHMARAKAKKKHPAWVKEVLCASGELVVHCKDSQESQADRAWGQLGEGEGDTLLESQEATEVSAEALERLVEELPDARAGKEQVRAKKRWAGRWVIAILLLLLLLVLYYYYYYYFSYYYYYDYYYFYLYYYLAVASLRAEILVRCIKMHRAGPRLRFHHRIHVIFLEKKNKNLHKIANATNL